MLNLIHKNIFLLIVFSLISAVHAETENLENTPPKKNQDNLEKIVLEQPQVVDQKYYQVELILFEHNNNSGTKNENWSRPQEINIDDTISSDIETYNTITTDAPRPKSGQISSKMASQLASYSLRSHLFTALDKDFTPLDKEQYQLNDEYQRIQQSGHFNALAYLGWIQPGLAKEQAKIIDILGTTSKDISGHIKIVLSRYLHAHIDLVSHQEVCIREQALPITQPENELNQNTDQAYNPEKQAENLDSTKVEISIDSRTANINCREQNIAFKQSRKMRSKELHYIDNPAMGILILITPVENQPLEMESPSEQKINIESA